MPPVTPPSEGLDTTEIDAEVVRSALAETSADHPPFEHRSGPYLAHAPSSETFRERVGLPDHPEPFYRRQMTWVIAVFCLIAILFAYPRLSTQELDTGPRITTIQVDPAAPSGAIADGQDVPRDSSSGSWFDVDKPTTSQAVKKTGKPRAKPAASGATEPAAEKVDEESDAEAEPTVEETEEIGTEEVDEADPKAGCEETAAVKTPIINTPIVTDACDPAKQEAGTADGDNTETDPDAADKSDADTTADAKTSQDEETDPTDSKTKEQVGPSAGNKSTVNGAKDPSPATKPTVPAKQPTVDPDERTTTPPKKPVGVTTATTATVKETETTLKTEKTEVQDKEDEKEAPEKEDPKGEDPTTGTTAKPGPDDDLTEPVVTQTTVDTSEATEADDGDGDETDTDDDDEPDDAPPSTL